MKGVNQMKKRSRIIFISGIVIIILLVIVMLLWYIITGTGKVEKNEYAYTFQSWKFSNVELVRDEYGKSIKINVENISDEKTDMKYFFIEFLNDNNVESEMTGIAKFLVGDLEAREISEVSIKLDDVMGKKLSSVDSYRIKEVLE